MSNLSIVRERKEKGELVTIDTILDLLRPEEFDRIEAMVRLMREKFPCPFVVRDYDEFKQVIILFWAHYQKVIFNADYHLDKHEMPGLIKEQAFGFLEQHLGGMQAWNTAERNAIMGREGGMIAVIDTMTDALVKFQTQLYIRSVFLDLISPSDYDARLRLAQELLKKYAPVLFAGEELKPFWILGGNLEQFVQGFTTHLHALRREWRR